MYRKILSLDGGGTWAVIQVMALQKLYTPDATGSEVLRHFDLVVANSGGSIVAAGLFLNLKLSEIRALFETTELRQQIFVSVAAWKRAIETIVSVGPKFDAAAKLAGLQRIFDRYAPKVTVAAVAEQHRQRTGTPCDLVLIGYNYDRDRATFFRSSQNSRAAGSWAAQDVSLAGAVHASSNAPVNYFDAPAEVTVGGRRQRFWDGAIAGFNNPVMAGVVEALSNGTPSGDVRVLSLGTGNVFLPLHDPTDECTAELDVLELRPKPSGFRTDLPKLATSILSDPPDAASFIAHVTLGGPIPANPDETSIGPVTRLNPLIQPVLATGNRWILPPNLPGTQFQWGGFPVDAPAALNEEEFGLLRDLDLAALEPDEIALIIKFAETWMADHVPNQPVRPHKQLDCQIGHRWFSQGLAQAKIDFP